MEKGTDWDVEQYKTEHECDEHWELRRKFILAHKDRFPEDELVCLAQVFTNVELLGCRYPSETMKLIAELAQDVAAEYREKQKSKLQRTFVKASDVASSKVKGISTPVTSVLQSTETGVQIKDYNKNTDVQINTERTESNRKAQNNKEQNKRVERPPDTQQVPCKKKKLSAAPYGNMVLVERPNSIPQGTLASAVSAAGGTIDWRVTKHENTYTWAIYINSKYLAEATDTNTKLAKLKATEAGLQELQKYYYTIKIKYNFSTEDNVTSSSILKSATTPQAKLSDDNIGRKLMNLMGWTGGGLGKSEQGIVEPITVQEQIHRNGLGLKPESSTTHDFRRKIKDILDKFRMGNMRNDIVFSADFPNEERAVIHRIAQNMGLKSHSYGKKDKRTLVVSRKIRAEELLTELKNLGGVTDKYELVEPTELNE